MKIFRATWWNDKYWRSITEIGGVEVIHIDKDNHKSSSEDSRRKDDAHFITYDKEDWRNAMMGLPEYAQTDMMLKIKDKVSGRICENEHIVLLIEDYHIRVRPEYELFSTLKEEKSLHIHIIGEIYDKTISDDYRERLRCQYHFESFDSFCFINYCAAVYEHSENINKGRNYEKNYFQYKLSFLPVIIKAITDISQPGQMIYDNKKNKYKPLVLPEGFVFLDTESKHLLEYITPGHGRETCREFRKYRRQYAKTAGINRKEPECSYVGECHGVCHECDNRSSYIWQKKNDIEIRTQFNTVCQIEKVHLNGIERLRIDTDGAGVRSLILLAGCPLDCRYCGNRSVKDIFPHTRVLSVRELGELLHKDGIYFEMSGGGVTFGGGEPLLQADFIRQFHEIYPMWSIDVQTSLNVDFAQVEKLIDVVDEWQIDIKDISPDIYKAYTGGDNARVIENLTRLVKLADPKKLRVRIPGIAGYNTAADVEHSASWLREAGFLNIELFDYIIG
ncbi:MAG: radical SAM protein [Oscillospiraceae bacterium]